MKFDEFLSFVKVVKMLYGRDVACKLFETNYRKYYNLSSVSFLNLDDEEK